MNSKESRKLKDKNKKETLEKFIKYCKMRFADNLISKGEKPYEPWILDCDTVVPLSRIAKFKQRNNLVNWSAKRIEDLLILRRNIKLSRLSNRSTIPRGRLYPLDPSIYNAYKICSEKRSRYLKAREEEFSSYKKHQNKSYLINEANKLAWIGNVKTDRKRVLKDLYFAYQTNNYVYGISNRYKAKLEATEAVKMIKKGDIRGVIKAAYINPTNITILNELREGRIKARENRNLPPQKLKTRKLYFDYKRTSELFRKEVIHAATKRLRTKKSAVQQ